jgi:hypothetical protein
MSLVLTGKSKDFEFGCGVYSPNDKLKPLKSNPGEMIWKLGSRVLAKSSEYVKVNFGQLSFVNLPLCQWNSIML